MADCISTVISRCLPDMASPLYHQVLPLLIVLASVGLLILLSVWYKKFGVMKIISMPMKEEENIKKTTAMVIRSDETLTNRKVKITESTPISTSILSKECTKSTGNAKKLYNDRIIAALVRTVEAADGIDGWKSMGCKKGVDIAKKVVDGSDIVSIRGRGVVKADAIFLADFIFDLHNVKSYNPMHRYGYRIETLDQNSVVNYIDSERIWPVTQRDFNYLSCVRRFPDGRYVVGGQSVEHLASPPLGNRVRGCIIVAGYVIEPTSDPNASVVTFVAQVDPKGFIPKFLVNLVSVDQPMVIDAIRKVTEHRTVEQIKEFCPKVSLEIFEDARQAYKTLCPEDIEEHKVIEVPRMDSVVPAKSSVQRCVLGRFATSQILAHAQFPEQMSWIYEIDVGDNIDEDSRSRSSCRGSGSSRSDSLNDMFYLSVKNKCHDENSSSAIRLTKGSIQAPAEFVHRILLDAYRTGRYASDFDLTLISSCIESELDKDTLILNSLHQVSISTDQKLKWSLHTVSHTKTLEESPCGGKRIFAISQQSIVDAEATTSIFSLVNENERTVVFTHLSTPVTATLQESGWVIEEDGSHRCTVTHIFKLRVVLDDDTANSHESDKHLLAMAMITVENNVTKALSALRHICTREKKLNATARI